VVFGSVLMRARCPVMADWTISEIADIAADAIHR